MGKVETLPLCPSVCLKSRLSFRPSLQLLSQGAFGYLLPIVSFVLAWIETWLLDFKVLPQEIDDENRERAHLVARLLPFACASPSCSCLRIGFRQGTGSCRTLPPQNGLLSSVKAPCPTASSTRRLSRWQVSAPHCTFGKLQ